MSVIGTLFRMVLERGARGKTYADFERALAKTGKTVDSRFSASSDTPSHRQKGQHIVGIERWAQSRLRVTLGEPLQRDEYDSYRPGDDLDLPALAREFVDTREESIRISQHLQAANVSLEETIPHNQFGDLSVAGWLSYMISHAGRESRLL